jgi:hypothetical protein
MPCPTPTTLTLSQGTYNLVAKAHLALGRLDFAVRRLPDPRLLVRPVLRREAQSTSELEGTYAPLDEVLAALVVSLARYARPSAEAPDPAGEPAGSGACGAEAGGAARSIASGVP